MDKKSLLNLLKVGSLVSIEYENGIRLSGRIGSVAEDTFILIGSGNSSQITFNYENLKKISSININYDLVDPFEECPNYTPILYRPFPNPDNGFLKPMGRIQYIKPDGWGFIADVKSQRTLIFNRNELLKDDLYNTPNEELKGTPVFYCIVKAGKKYVAKSVIKPLLIDDAIEFAKQFKKRYKLQAMALCQAIYNQEKRNPKLNQLIEQLEKDQKVYNQRDKWKFEAPIPVDNNAKKIVINNNDSTAELERKNKKDITETGIIVTWSGTWGQIQSKNGNIYSFNQIDIAQEGLILALQKFRDRKAYHQQIPVICSFDEKLKKATFVHQCCSLTDFANTISVKIRTRKLHIAKGLLEIALLQFPAEERLIQLCLQLKEMEEERHFEFDTSENTLLPCGYVLTLPAEKSKLKKGKNADIRFARIKDNYLLQKVLYDPIDFIGLSCLETSISIDQSLVYQIVETDRTSIDGHVYQAKFIIPIKPIEETLALANDLLQEGKYIEAWGISKNILDQQPDNEAARSLMNQCESHKGFVTPTCIDFYSHIHLAEKCFTQGLYQDALFHYKYSFALGLRPELFTRKIMECYNLRISQTSDISQKITLQNEYIQFGKENIERIASNNVDDFNFKLAFYSELCNHKMVITLLENRLLILSRTKNKKAIASIYAAIAKEYILLGEEESIRKALQNINYAIKIDQDCILARHGQGVIKLLGYINNNKKNIHSNTFPNFDVTILFEKPLVEVIRGVKIKASVYEERLVILEDLQKTTDKSIAIQLLLRYISTLIYTNSEEYQWNTRDIANKTLGHLLFELSEKIFDSMILNADSINEIQVLSFISPLTAEVLSQLIFQIKPDAIIDNTFEDFINIGVGSAFFKHFAKWRASCYSTLERLNATKNLMCAEDVLSQFLVRLDSLSLNQWKITSDIEIFKKLKSEIVPLLFRYNEAPSEANIVLLNTKRKVEEFIAIIKLKPTLLQIAIILPILRKLKSLLDVEFNKNALSIPNPKISVVCTSATNSMNEILIEVEVRNQGNNVYPIKILSLTPEDNTNLKFLHELVPSKTEELAEQEFEIFHFNAQLINDDNLASVACNFKLVYSYDNRENNQDFSLTVPIIMAWESLKNPYSGYGTEVHDDNMFFGRKDILDEIYDAICPKEYDPSKQLPTCQYLLYGQKRCGKSSVLFFLKERFNNNSRLICLRVDFGDIITESDCYKMIIDCLFDKAKELYEKDEIDKFELPSNYNSSNYSVNVQDFRRCLASFKKIQQESIHKENRNKQIVLLIDEFSAVFKLIRTGEISPNFIETWRSLFSDESTQFSAVLICKDVMPSIIDEYGNKNVFGVFTKQRLNYLLPEYARELICKPILSKNDRINNFYHDGAVDRILYYTACSAFYTYFFCCFLIRYANKRRLSLVTKYDVDIVAEEVAKNIEQADGFDAILKAGEDDNVSSFPEKTVKSVLDKIADLEIQNSQGCYVSQIQNIYNETNIPEQEYLETVIKDLKRRDVVNIQNNKITINIKLYLLWHQYQQESNLI